MRARVTLMMAEVADRSHGRAMRKTRPLDAFPAFISNSFEYAHTELRPEETR